MIYAYAFGGLALGFITGWCFCALLVAPEILELRRANQDLRKLLSYPYHAED